jgi:predicted ATPase/class 3 adenylate cyclase
MAELPSGTVTFLFTDIEGSTARWEQQPEAMRVALARHDVLVRSAIQQQGGSIVKTMGDAFHAAFARASDALAAALDAQRELQAEPWGHLGALCVRMALHTGAAEERDGDYYGPSVNRAARLAGIGHGGQVLLSQATCELVRDALPEGTDLLDLGGYRLKGLARPERVYQLVAPGLPSTFPPLRTLDARPNNLPTHPTALLGREHQVAEVCALLKDGARFVTLTGPGGTGKTRLSLQVAADLLEQFEHGVFLVELASISDPVLVPSVIAQAIDVRDTGERPVLELLREYLGSRVLLLVLDNFEQVLSSASVVAGLLTACPGLKVLATSREPLRLRGEQEYAVPPLALPDTRQPVTPESVARSSAATLFVQRATAIRPDFVVGGENAPAIAEICARVDGLPLAIELAAARVRLLTPQAMAQRLERRLPLLVGGARDLPARQQTLRDTIAWSHDLLDEQERRLLRRLAVFVGGWTLDAADAVCNVDGDLDVLGGVESLLAKSLVKRGGDDLGEPRFGMLETIREYGLERLEASGDAESTRRAHASYFLALAEDAALRVGGREQRVSLRRLEAAHDDLRAVLRWSVAAQGDVQVGLRIVGALVLLWFFHGLAAEGYGWATTLLAQPGATAPTVARAQALFTACVMANMRGEYVAQRSWSEESAAIFRQHGDLRWAGRALTQQAVAEASVGSFEVSRTLLETSETLARKAEDHWGLAFALSHLGFVDRLAGDYIMARVRCEESAAVAREIGDRFTLALALNGLSHAAQLQGDWQTATVGFREVLLVTSELEDSRLMLRALIGLAGAAVLAEVFGRAARLLGAAEAVRGIAAGTMAPWVRAIREHDTAVARAALGDEEFAAAWDQGRAMSLEQAVAYALDEASSPQ